MTVCGARKRRAVALSAFAARRMRGGPEALFRSGGIILPAPLGMMQAGLFLKLSR